MMDQISTGSEIAINTNERKSSEVSKYENDGDELLKSFLTNNPNQQVLVHIEKAGIVYQNASPSSNYEEDDSSDDEIESDEDTHDLKCTRKLQITGQKQSNFLWRLGNSLFYLLRRDNTYGLQQKLKNYYENLTVARVTWLDEERDKLIKDYYANLEFQIDGQPILLQQIFENKDGLFSTRVLIEGQPGYGKTTMANKIAYDWSVGEKYLQRFKICLLQSLRSLRNRSIEEGIKAIAENCDYDYVSNVIDVIRSNSSSTLLILDGLDEMSTAAREDILKVLYGKQMFKEMTVLATSRTGLFNLKPEELKNLHGGNSMKSQFYEKKIRILGIVEDEQQTFLEKFMSADSVKSITDQIMNLTGPVEQLFRSPLFLALLAIMIESKKNLDEFRTKTLLYKNLTNFVIRRSFERKDVFLPEDFDMFNPELRHCKKYQITFYQFGQQALKQLQNNNLQFDCNEVTYKIYEFGFLMNNKIALPFQSRKHFEPFHLSIVEFASAFYLWRDYVMNGFLFSEKNLKTLKQVMCQSEGTSLLPSFLAGLMGERVQEFFFQFNQFAYIISTSSNNFWDIINECHVNTKCLNVLSDFIPIYIQCSPDADFASQNFQLVAELAFKINKFFPVCEYSFVWWHIPQNILVQNFLVEVEDLPDTISEEQWLNVLHNVKSNYLEFSIHHFENIRKTFDIFTSIQAKKKILSIYRYAKFSDCVKEVENYTFKNFIFGIRLYLTNEYCITILKTLLQKNVIENLEMLIPINIEINSFGELFASIAMSAQLESLSFLNMNEKEFTIDLNKLTQNGTKTWKKLEFQNVLLKGLKEVVNPNLIMSFDVNNPGYDYDAVNALIKLSCKILQCCASLLNSTLIKCNSWPGYKSVINLTILVDDNVDYKSFWSNLAKFPYLEMLGLKLRNEYLSLNLQDLSIAKLKINLWSILSLKYLKLFSSDNYLHFVSALLNEKVYIEQTEKLFPKLTQVDIITGTGKILPIVEVIDSLDLRIEIITCLLELLKMRLIDVAYFAVSEEQVIRQIVKRNIIDESIYRVVHEIYENTATGHQRWFNKVSTSLMFTLNSY